MCMEGWGAARSPHECVHTMKAQPNSCSFTSNNCAVTRRCKTAKWKLTFICHFWMSVCLTDFNRMSVTKEAVTHANKSTRISSDYPLLILRCSFLAIKNTTRLKIEIEIWKKLDSCRAGTVSGESMWTSFQWFFLNVSRIDIAQENLNLLCTPSAPREIVISLIMITVIADFRGGEEKRHVNEGSVLNISRGPIYR